MRIFRKMSLLKIMLGFMFVLATLLGYLNYLNVHSSTKVTSNFLKDDFNHVELTNKIAADNKDIENNELYNQIENKNQFAGNQQHIEKININVNNLQKVNGLYVNKTLYIPFDFLESYYEIHGHFIPDQPSSLNNIYIKSFFWSHSSLNFHDKNLLDFKPYQSFGEYLNFKSSDVAQRGRVKFISGINEVPVTTQWDINGYHYPIQIAQYGLSHLSRYYNHGLIDKPSDSKEIIIPSASFGSLKIVVNLTKNCFLKVKFGRRLTNFTVNVDGKDGKTYILQYVKSAHAFIKKTTNVIVHGLGKDVSVGSINRDLSVDLSKGLSYLEGRKEGLKVDISVSKVNFIFFEHVEFVKKATLGPVDHRALFMATANWFLKLQDKNGGWATNVSRNVMKGMRCDPGWYSAMGQGQAISLLSRVYILTKKVKYLEAALKATQLFHVLANESGIKAMLFDKYAWYEEYPVAPSLFVLNGFMYSVLGLYDLSKTAPLRQADDALFLFQQGIHSLETLLPLFDSGHGSFYDLRHITVKGHPPNRARWQYHKVHLELLHAIYDITKSQHILKTYNRWIDYANGVPSRHN